MPSTIDVTDLYSKKGARLLAQVIADYWLNRGHIVFVESFQIPETGLWGVRSTLVNGLPRRVAA
ncbi:hypothetical protein [Bradyrhizobium pachyrhizi]|uniref:hypothetical protein n=1 Tax=Bradyrhizobium pachyrhizi TaxID=280333 RepID=UPI0012E3E1AF|nr:hypothetical protein [Bradyrhizobium pachyrhizi]